jgi:acetoin utilization deacetylase AcuC-like enzyme
MDIYYSPRQANHSPDTFLVRGRPVPSPESTERADRLLAALQDAGLDVTQHPGDGSARLLQRLETVHRPRYLEFLHTIHERWQTLPNASDTVLPNVHPTGGGHHYPAHPVGQAGWHLHDMACPIGLHSFEGIFASAASAEMAAEAVLDGAREAYALCRPPGHHAGPESAGGFCFVNNSALAASILRERFARVAVVDVDLHHGNGTQDIFYRRDDVWTGSVHADPDQFYPFFWGSADERGEDAGAGCNLNVPLPVGSGGDAFMQGLEHLLEAFEAYHAEAVVIALGLDAHKDDPLAGMTLETADFARIAERLARLPQPCVIVQEGGYPTPALGQNLVAFLQAFMGARRG